MPGGAGHISFKGELTSKTVLSGVKVNEMMSTCSLSSVFSSLLWSDKKPNSQDGIYVDSSIT